jgi:CHAT domain-containing protein
LPFSAQEVSALEEIMGATVLMNGEATREALLAQMTAFGTLHLSSHAFATPEGSSPPRILTATESVYLPDVYAHRLNAALVTLSACQSNIGPLARGEGVLGMGRAFAAAGAQGVVASLWMLNDRAAADVNDRFYEQLARGVSKPVALHQAQLDYLNRTDMPAYLKSPYYWAGLTYYGDANPLPTSPNLWWFVFPILIVLAAAWRFLRSRDKT